MRALCTIFLLPLLLTACGQREATTFSPELMARGEALARSALIVDTHIDVPYRLQEKFEDVSKATTEGDFDHPRAVAGGLNTLFMSIYIPAEKEDEGTATPFANELIDRVEDIAAKSPAKFAIATNTTEVQTQFGGGKISFALGMENGAPIAGELANLQHFFDRGIRYITLTHSEANHICDSSYDENRPWGGLSPFGEELVKAMNDVGVMIDISHVSDEAFYDVLAITKAPLIASHSSARHFTPDFERNMDDAMIVALAETGGAIQINFGSSFVNNKSRRNHDKMADKRKVYLEDNGFESGGDEADAWTDEYRETTAFYFADITDVLDHFDHVRDLVGVDHVGIGSDFDGVGDSLPMGLKDVSFYPNLVAGLLDRGYSDEDIRKILGGNLMRVWREVENYARQSQGRR